MDNDKVGKRCNEVVNWLEVFRSRTQIFIHHIPGYLWQEVAIYDILRRIIDNSIDEFRLGHGNTIEINIDTFLTGVTVRDYGNGIPLDDLLRMTTKCGTSLNNSNGDESRKGYGLKIVNALCDKLMVRSYIDGLMREVVFEQGKLISDCTGKTTEQNGVFIKFRPDNYLFCQFRYDCRKVTQILHDCCCFNVGLKMIYNYHIIKSNDGIVDFLKSRTKGDLQYEPILLKGRNIEITFSHTWQDNEQYYSFVNGHYTPCGGLHLDALEDYLAPIIGQQYNHYTHSTLRKGLTAVISLHLNNPAYSDPARSRLGSTNMDLGVRIDKYVRKFLNKELRRRLSEDADLESYMLNMIHNKEDNRRLFIFLIILTINYKR